MNDTEYLDEQERHALELEWYEGRLLGHADRLMRFVQHHREEILSAAGGPSASLPRLVRAVHEVVAQHGVVHLPSELQDQMKQIHNEIWIRGEKGDYDRKRIQADWTEQFAGDWRQWRIKEYQFVAAHCADRIVSNLKPRLGENEAGP